MVTTLQKQQNKHIKCIDTQSEESLNIPGILRNKSALFTTIKKNVFYQDKVLDGFVWVRQNDKIMN